MACYCFLVCEAMVMVFKMISFLQMFESLFLRVLTVKNFPIGKICSSYESFILKTEMFKGLSVKMFKNKDANFRERLLVFAISR